MTGEFGSPAHVWEATASRHLRRRAVWAAIAAAARRHPLGAVGAVIVAITVVVGMAAPVLAPYDPLEISQGKWFMPPGSAFLLGTDNLGRDQMSRLLYGARISLYVGILSVALGTTTGAIVGVVSGYIGGKFDLFVQRGVDVIMGFPLMVLALAIVAVLGPSTNNTIVAIAIVFAPDGMRVLRSSALAVKENLYVDAARAVGASEWRIIIFHVLPQCMAPYIVLSTAELAWAIVVEATLSFLGMGTPSPTPSWGNMLAGDARLYAERAPWMSISPGVAISLVVFGINFFGDALRDELDPRLRQ